MRWVRKLYDWVVHWAKTPYAEPALFLLAFAEASFFPVPPDVLLIAMGVSQPNKALRYATLCWMGSVAGGLVGYSIGWGIWATVDQFFFSYIPGFTPEAFEKGRQLFNDAAFWSVFTAGFTPIPYKIITIAAGVAKTPLGIFFLASLLSRGARFFLVGGSLKVFGKKAQELIDRYFDLLAFGFTALLIGGFVLIKYLL